MAMKGLNKGQLFGQRRNSGSLDSVRSLSGLPSSVDWRTKKNILTPVKNQGQCGSCWAFASTENLESHLALKTGILQTLSPQFILDCVPNPQHCGGTGGCEGGTAKLAYDGLVVTKGMPSEWTYPYVSSTGNNSKCHGLPLGKQTPHSGVPMSVVELDSEKSHVSLESNSYEAVIDALANVGPLTVTVAAGDWHDYAGGIFSGGNHSDPILDHLVQLVGYGEEGGVGYWIVRNSWTPLWGESGYIRLARYGAGSEPCGIDTNPADGDGCEGGPATVKVCGQSGVLFDAVYPVLK